MWTVDEPFPASIWRAMDRAVLIGMAKPWLPWDWPLNWNEKPAEAAVSTPRTWPEVLTSAPPESPGWMSALVSMRPLSCSDVPSPWSLAVIDWLSAVTVPPAALGVPPVPPALPTPTTSSPTEALRGGEGRGLEPRGVLQLEHGDVLGAVVAHHAGRVGLLVAHVGDADASWRR